MILIRNLTLVLHLPLIKISLPAILILFVEGTIKIAMFDILGQSFFGLPKLNIGEFLKYEHLIHEEIRPQIQNIGYSNSVSLTNLGSIATFVFIYFIQAVILIVLVSFIKLRIIKSERIINWKNSLFETLIFTELFAILVDSIFEILITSQLQLNNFHTTNPI